MAASAGPSLAVVLFTDLVGSTSLRVSLGEERADELRQLHDRLLTERVEAHSGQVVKGLGDGLMAVFSSAADALTASVEGQQAIVAYNQRPDALAALSVRMGLSVGDVSWESGECFGTPVVEAARLVAVAEGAQIVCSDFVRVMARGRGAHRFRPLGPFDLKGLPDPLETCEVEWEPPEYLTAERLSFPRSLTVRSPLAFVGREEELADAERHLQASEGLALLWVMGEPGIGKTRLAAELARRAYDRGWDVLAGRCDEDLAVPFQPFLGALRDFVATATPAMLAERLGEQPAELARLLPELTTLVPELVPPPATDPAVERYRLFEAVRSWLTATAGARPLLFVLDDLHWADAATVQLLGHLARSAAPAPLRMVGTLRDTEPGRPELRRLLDEVAPLAGTIALGGLGTAGVARLVEAATGRSSAWDGTGLAEQIQRESGGNPLFVTAVLTGLETGGVARELPADVTAAVRRRVSRLPLPAQDLLNVASVAGLEFDLRVVSGVLGLSMPDGLEAVEAAVRAHLAEETGVNHYRFAHALVRGALHREIGPSRLAHYHARVGEALETVHGGRLDEHAEELAFHFGEALAAGGPPDRALRYTLAAAERATAQYASDNAVERYRRALEILDGDPQADRRSHCQVLTALGEALVHCGHFDAARTTLRRAADEAASGFFPDLMVKAAFQFAVATTYLGVASDDAIDLLERAAQRLDPGDSELRASVLTGLGRALGTSPRFEEATPVLEEAVAMARRIGARRNLGEALAGLSVMLLGPGHAGRRLASAVEEGDIGREIGNLRMAGIAAIHTAASLLEMGRMSELRTVLAEVEELYRQAPAGYGPFYMSTLGATLGLVQGRFEAAEQKALAAREAGREVFVDPEGVYGVQMFGIRREQGRLGQIAPALRALVTLGGGGRMWAPGVAALYAELGLAEEARDALEPLLTTERVLVEVDSRRGLSLSYLADAVTALGDGERAAVLYRELLPYAALCIATFTTACYGPASRYLGMLATTMGRFDDAEAHFEDALVRCDRLESPTWAAHTQYEFARMLVARRRGDDAARAELLARAALETTARIGMRALQERAGRLLESGLEVEPG